MNYKEIRETIENMANDNIKDLVKAIISFEKGINDEEALDKIYDAYMDNDTQGLLSDEFDYMIDDMKEQGLVIEEVGIKEERDDLINIVGNITKEVEKIELTNNQGQKFKVVNFSVVSNDEEGKKIYHNCSAYEDKGKIPENFQKGDFVKLFGQVRKSIDENGKEYTNIRILDSKLLKAKERGKGQEEKKESILGAIKKHKERKTQSERKDIEEFIIKINEHNGDLIDRDLEIVKGTDKDSKHSVSFHINPKKLIWIRKIDDLSVESGNITTLGKNNLDTINKFLADKKDSDLLRFSNSLLKKAGIKLETKEKSNLRKFAKKNSDLEL